LRTHRIIRPLFAGFLLALFALAITPKLAIHALVAHHTDSHVSLRYGHADQYNTAGFHCDTDNLVVECPFLYYPEDIALGLQPVYPEYRPSALARFIAAAHPLFGLRGPPALLFSAC
jgi:hypothetical protein